MLEAGGRGPHLSVTMPIQPAPLRPVQIPMKRLAGAAVMLGSLGLVSLLTLVHSIIRIFD